MRNFLLEDFVKQALLEDIADGDHTTLACIPADKHGVAELKIKETGILAGTDVAQAIFHQFDPRLKFQRILDDGQRVEASQVAFRVQGPVQSILSTERLVLNLMQRMSGIATVTARYVDRVKHTNAKVLDTRKTTPGLRWFEKEAVKIGGGQNHRFGLFDMILIKDNHVDACGGLSQALDSAATYLKDHGLQLDIEVEVRSQQELEQALDHGGMQRIMLDNFSVAHTSEAVAITRGRCALESSGGITLDTIAAYAQTGVDFISVGALTHSVKSLDLSLKIMDV